MPVLSLKSAIPSSPPKKKDLANPNKHHQDCIAINAHCKTSIHKIVCGDDGVLSWIMYQKLLKLVEFKPKEAISREATLLIFMIGVPNIAKSVLIISIHQIASSCFPV
ncbi:hypothetical protein ACB092_09G208000 [Castanea dentata]